MPSSLRKERMYAGASELTAGDGGFARGGMKISFAKLLVDTHIAPVIDSVNHCEDSA
jgi:hypothetical protein